MTDLGILHDNDNTNPDWKAEHIYNMAFTNYLSNFKYDRLHPDTVMEQFEFGGGNKDRMIQRIKEKLADPNCLRVRCCYMTTSIREYHERFIVWIRKPQNPNDDRATDTEQEDKAT